VDGQWHQHRTSMKGACALETEEARTTDGADEVDDATFDRQAHVRYLKTLLRNGLPSFYVVMDSVRTTALYFAVVGLDMLGEIDQLDPVERASLVTYVYSMQLDADLADDTSPGHCGFIGSGCLGAHAARLATGTRDPNICGLCDAPPVVARVSLAEFGNYRYKQLVQGHLAMAYTSLAILVTLGDDLSGVDRENLIRGNVLGPCSHGFAALVVVWESAGGRRTNGYTPLTHTILMWHNVSRDSLFTAARWQLRCDARRE
jgi:geranylgeranyl transferase type-1 subunit beta